jgi:hypothetical protein
MERSYLISPNAGISTVSSINSTTNPELNPNPSVFYGIFGCNKKDLDFISNTKVPYISSKTSATIGTTVSSLAINTPSCSAGDLLLCFGGTKSASRTWLSEVGWTLETQSSVQPNLVVYSRIATNSEPSTYTFDITGGDSQITLIMICIKNWNSYTVGSFGAQNNPPTISVPNDTSDKKLLLFFIGNDGNNRSWDVNTITEFQISLVNTDVSLDLSAIYRSSSNTSLSYATTQTGAGANSHGLTILVK